MSRNATLHAETTETTEAQLLRLALLEREVRTLDALRDAYAGARAARALYEGNVPLDGRDAGEGLSEPQEARGETRGLRIIGGQPGDNPVGGAA